MITSFFKLLSRCYRLALPYGRLKLFAVLGLILFNGLLQLIGVTSIFPFFALAADPERIRNSTFGTWFLNLLPQMNNNHLLVVAGCFSILMLVIASLGSMVSEYLRVRYGYGFSHWLRGRILRSYASQPYSYFLRRNSAALTLRVFDIQNFTQSVLLPIGEIITKLVLVALLLGTLILVQPWIALGGIVILGGFYFIVFLWVRPRTKVVGDGLQRHSVEFNKNTNQLLHGIKTVFIHEKSSFFIQRSLEHSLQIGRYQGLIPLYSNGPRYLIEPIAFGGLVAIVIVLAIQGRPFSDILPNLSVMALAAAKLLPALQLLYSQLVTAASNSYTLGQLEEEIMEIEEEASLVLQDCPKKESLFFCKEISLENLTFAYPCSAHDTIESFSLTIRKNESIGIAGPSGSGKSTLVDLILGLHSPRSGRLLVDGMQLTKKTLRAWRQMIGYVPQDIYLLDDTVQANIAFGIKPEEIDLNALREAASGAQILEFIEKELPEGFKTTVGERGVRLSGGQRQRIGLARALYHHPQVLILDEATSALDHNTEAAVMDTIHQLQGKMTMITIAHRLSTLERCDRVVELVRKVS
ncbi:MAG: ATP-binding cassette domain-containing protein [Chthoniobacterales bacterium]